MIDDFGKGIIELWQRWVGSVQYGVIDYGEKRIELIKIEGKREGKTRAGEGRFGS